jgi:hydroxyethylthiazole kinase-like uncharacterized protein yjeF
MGVLIDRGDEPVIKTLDEREYNA